MSIVQNNILIHSVPVGLINDITNIVSLAGEITNKLYQNDDVNSYEMWQQTIDDNFQKVNIIIEYNIEEDMATCFKLFIRNKIDDMISKYNDLNKSWRLEAYDRC